jgi:hypothetical protein
MSTDAFGAMRRSAWKEPAMIRRMLGRTAAVVTLLVLPGIAAAADGPLCGFFQPRGGAYYSPLHFWAPAAYRVKFCLHGPECPGCRVSVCPPGRPVAVSVVGPAMVAPAAANPIPGSAP